MSREQISKYLTKLFNKVSYKHWEFKEYIVRPIVEFFKAHPEYIPLVLFVSLIVPLLFLIILPPLPRGGTADGITQAVTYDQPEPTVFAAVRVLRGFLPEAVSIDSHTVFLVLITMLIFFFCPFHFNRFLVRPPAPHPGVDYSPYSSLLIFAALVFVLCVLLTGVAYVFSLTAAQDTEKRSEYECGFAYQARLQA